MEKKSDSKFSSQYIDENIKKLLSQRDTKLLTQLFAEINPYLFRVCAASSIYDEHAEEVIYETWATFFSSIEKFEARSTIRTYLCGILFNKIREYRRLQGKFLFEDDSEKSFEKVFSPDGWWNNEPHDPHKISETKQVSEFIKECLEGLSEQQKTAFVLREVEDESSNEICSILGVEVNNLRVLLFRAKEKLRQCLEGKISYTEYF